MQETFFTSSVMMGFFNFIKEIGLLNFIAGGIAVMAFGYGYHQLHPNATVPRSKNWSGIGLVLSRVVLARTTLDKTKPIPLQFLERGTVALG